MTTELTEKNTSVTQAERQRLAKLMTPELLQEAENTVSDMAKNANRSITEAYKIGERVTKIKNSEDNTYGANAIELYSEYVGIQTTSLYRFAGLSETFTRDALHDMITTEEGEPRITANGKPLSLEQLLTAVQLKDPEAITATVEKIYNTGTSANDLRGQLSLAEKKNVRSGGRKPAKPSTPQLLVHKTKLLFKKTNNFVNENVSAFDELPELEPEEVNSATLIQLREALDACEEMKGTIKLTEASLKKAVARSEEILTEAENEGQSEAADDPKAKSKATKPVKKAAKPVEDDEDEPEVKIPARRGAQPAKPKPKAPQTVKKAAVPAKKAPPKKGR